MWGRFFVFNHTAKRHAYHNKMYKSDKNIYYSTISGKFKQQKRQKEQK
jgi:hypothetical protein